VKSVELPASVLILHAGALGDCVLAVALAMRMKREWCDPSVSMLSRSPIARWAARRGYLDFAGLLDEFGAHRLYDPSSEWSAPLAEMLNRHELTVSFLGGSFGAINERLAGLRRGRAVAIDPALRASTARLREHITEQWSNDLAAAGFPLHSPVEIDIRLEHREAAPGSGLRDRLRISTGSIVLLHPGSGGLHKCAPVEVMESWISRLRRAGFEPAWIVGPDEMERFGESWAHRLESSARVLYEESVELAAELIAAADGYIGFDSGMTHVAAMTGMPTLAVFGPTDERVWRPPFSNCCCLRFGSLNRPSDAETNALVRGIENALMRSSRHPARCDREAPRRE